MAVDIDMTDGFTAGAPRVLFRAKARNMYDVSPDGERFVMVHNDETSQPRINVVLDWFSELEKLVPTDE
jgi:hypothetical protein